VRLGRSLAVVDCDLFDHDKRIVAKALMTFAIISRGGAEAV
jgi:acyl-coenzyme A thioesterase PaaI-like protein